MKDVFYAAASFGLCAIAYAALGMYLSTGLQNPSIAQMLQGIAAVAAIAAPAGFLLAAVVEARGAVGRPPGSRFD